MGWDLHKRAKNFDYGGGWIVEIVLYSHVFGLTASRQQSSRPLPRAGPIYARRILRPSTSETRSVIQTKSISCRPARNVRLSRPSSTAEIKKPWWTYIFASARPVAVLRFLPSTRLVARFPKKRNVHPVKVRIAGNKALHLIHISGG